MVSDENCRVSVGSVTFSLDLEYLLDINLKINFLRAAGNICITLVHYTPVHLLALELLKTFNLYKVCFSLQQRLHH